jgi:glucose uptake protein
MILPPSYAITLTLLILGMLCWGSWASLFKAAGKVRFELFYFDFAFGTVLLSLICALTFGTLGFDGFSFSDDLLHAAKKQDAIGIIAGGVFNLGNMLLLGSIAEAGMAVAFPIGIGMAIVAGSVWNFFLTPAENIGLLVFGLVVIAFAVILCSTAYRAFKLSQVDELVRTGQQKSTRRQVSSKAVLLALIAGLILGSYFPLVTRAMAGDAGLGPYSESVMFAVGIVMSTFFYNLFFMNLPISGRPLEILEYFRATGRQHLLGLLAGAVWILGLIAALVSSASEGKAVVGRAISFGLLQGAVLIAALWGLLYWKEFPGADGRIRSMLLIVIALLVCGIGVVAVAPVWTRG